MALQVDSILDLPLRNRDNLPIVAKFRIDSLGALSRQMEFTPQDTRAAQVDAAEKLLHSIDANKAYPLDFVIFRITGYRPKKVSEDLLAGVALQHDLGLLIEHVSDSLDISSERAAEPVLAIEDVCERFNVTSKTIQRWRRKGLPARRFVFPDGKRRVGFLLSSVELFFATHQDQVARGMNFSLVSADERDEMIRRGRRLASECGCCEGEISRRIGKKLSRSPATVLHILRKYDQEHAEAPIFPSAAVPLTEEQRERIVRGWKRGLPLKLLAHRVRRSRASVYRVILDQRIEKLGRRKVKFIDDPLYHQEDASQTIDTIVNQDELVASNGDEHRVPRDLPPYLADLYRTPLLTPSKERALFLKFSFHKFQFVSARRELEPRFARWRDLDLMEKHLHQATQTKNAILRANMRLIVSVARKHLRPGVSLMELMSEGSLVLMRAVESFDIHRGHRFSTYATLALMKGFARSVPQMLAARRGSNVDPMVLHAIPDYRFGTENQQLVDREQVRQLLGRLDDRERAVVRAHFGIADRESPDTLESVGSRLGLSRQRLRQIERLAMAKLRDAAGASLS